ncbi:hypothetical protein AWC05_00260 [Mycobacterium florentinum]|uniref:Sulfotransferase domain-containing protein n=2 Tax=Mycobacterium florentinum TaxID=292462 RepID=A0A1X1ULS1_MYCFL|nr:hypothetical protein AWC05_00260 [Mycobacterium florentinum]
MADPAGPQAVMSEIAGPCAIWGEKNPRYAMKLDIPRRCLPDAIVAFVLRDPREVVNSCTMRLRPGTASTPTIQPGRRSTSSHSASVPTERV